METFMNNPHLSFHDALPTPITTTAITRKQINVSNVMLNDFVSKSESNDQDFCDDDMNRSGHSDIFSEKSQSVTARNTECQVNNGPAPGKKVKSLVKDSVQLQYEKTSFQMMQVKRGQKSHKGCSKVNFTSLNATCSGCKDLKHQSNAEFIESQNHFCQHSMLMIPLTNRQRPQSNSLLFYEQISQPQAVRPESLKKKSTESFVLPSTVTRREASSFMKLVWII
ncbi:hypothetical protein PoB_006110900 [Plakobranchus ocellatus]|uniref:Uncharacterized protein n=1 Tax=Plakobranchus ocellatus TaxID=259542 RepID=A0AAV4CRY7_9GAST|nr:hypothetical protein PoB_006110900 [Plakobranchus ocellatus]